MAKTPANIRGNQLISFFQDALNALILSETAKHHAQTAEDHIASQLQASPTNNVYTKPEDIGQEQLEALAHQSLDAHLKTVQSKQLSAASHQKLAELQVEAARQFTKKRITVQQAKPGAQSISIVFFDPRTGRQYMGKRHPAQAKGRVMEVSVAENYFIVTPSWLARKLKPNRLAFVIEVLDLSNLEPNVYIDIA